MLGSLGEEEQGGTGQSRCDVTASVVAWQPSLLSASLIKTSQVVPRLDFDVQVEEPTNAETGYIHKSLSQFTTI